MITGSCLCGAVQFGVTDFSSAIFKCHCSKCRKASGGASSAAALAGGAHFSWLQGEEGVREFQCESGFKRRFCPGCGSILPQFLTEYQLYWIPVGLLDSDPGIPLKHHIHVDSKAAWDILDADTQRFAEGFESS
ncbi:MAG: GFA family protein [Halioglobus sp.]|nr:GFA family protein [Halioglobus sp.]